ncbi:MAG: hypothetical protein KGL11_01890 [Alphaproteobacteria bacterium]|nr:hypothetical protein [Alphaproteobacteria bacterium]
MIGARALGLLIAVLAVSGCSYRSLNAPVAAPAAPDRPQVAALDPGRTVSVEIFANKDWQGTGVIVEPGFTYKVTAAGRWTIGQLCGMSDADAVGLNPLCKNDPEHLGVPASTLIGRIGQDGKPFGVGSNTLLKPSAKGELFLTIYTRKLAFASGSLKVDIAIMDAAAGQPEPAHHDIQ